MERRSASLCPVGVVDGAQVKVMHRLAHEVNWVVGADGVQ
jgi:hypothetical protein